MINNFSKDLEVGVHTNSLKNKELEEIIDLITIENKRTILSKLSTNLIKSYLDLAIKLPSLKKELTVEGAVTYMAEKFELDLTLNTPEKLLLGQDFTLKTLLDSRLVALTFDGLVAKQMTDFSGKLDVTGDSIKALAKWQNQALIAKDNAFNKFSIVSEMRFVGQELNLSKLDARLDELAMTHGFTYNRATVRNQKTRWGSCSGKNNISLNMQLMNLPKQLIDYVILHELVHTLVKNHSPLFWETLNSYVINAKYQSKELKNYRLY